MKNYIISVITSIAALAPLWVDAGEGKSPTEMSTLQSSIGKVILSADSYLRYDHSDTNPFGISQAFVIFKDEHQKNIKTLPVDQRVDYFWAGLWHLGLQGGYLTEFVELVSLDCADEFIKKLERYVKMEEKLQRNRTRLAIAKTILNNLKRLRANP
ncbi:MULTISPECIES: hypothetical protein [unclassified Microbulbifer]|uniref:hypothetical protein n=1 Tax=unclassified Microbulbifer TaxID=2619833 RepID=UPI0027E531E7|nr:MULTISPECIES: hypothetical protein [unclassified Microbulbifer]